MIPVINFGSEEGVRAGDVGEDHAEDTETVKEGKRSIKGAIPKLEQEDRLQVLPVIIKLLFSKLLKKKGAINKKSIHTRRNIVYAFLSGLDPQSEYPLFFKELLEPLNLADLLDVGVEIDRDRVLSRLSTISFSQALSFICSLEVIFKQLGSLLSCNDYLIKLAQILVLVLSLAKRFTGNLKEGEEDGDAKDAGESQLYKFVGKQSKMCMRKGLKTVRELFAKFSHHPAFITDLSRVFYAELARDQLAYLKERYGSEKSQLVEILAVGWSSHPNCMANYTAYPDVLPSLLTMLASAKVDPSVVQQLMSMVKSLVLASLEKSDKKKRLLAPAGAASGSDEDDEVMEDANAEEAQRELAKKIVSDNVNQIGLNLHRFWVNNQQRLKHAVVGRPARNQQNSGHQIKEQS